MNNLDNVPQDMKDAPRWGIRRKSYGKQPLVDGGESTDWKDSSKWMSLKDALKCQRKYKDFLGLSFALGDEYVGFDFDDIYDVERQMRTHKVAWQIIDDLKENGAFAEFSMSGTGVHVIVKQEDFRSSKKVDELIRRITMAKSGFNQDWVEFYWNNKFFATASGLAISNGTEDFTKDSTDVLARSFASIVECNDIRERKPRDQGFIPTDLSDNQILEIAAKASNASKFSDLWTGQWKDYGKTQSSADIALLNMLAFYTGCNKGQMKRMFQSSKLYRESKGETYLETSVDNAIDFCKETYSSNQEEMKYQPKMKKEKVKSDKKNDATDINEDVTDVAWIGQGKLTVITKFDGHRTIDKKFNVINSFDAEEIVSIIEEKKPNKEVIICNEIRSRDDLLLAKNIRKLYDERNPEPEDNELKKFHYRPKIRIATLRKPPELDSVDIKHFIEHDRQDELMYWLEAARTIEQYELYLNSNPLRFFMDKGITVKSVRDEILSEDRFIVTIGGTPYIYGNGYYQRDNDGICRKLIQDKLHDKTSTSHVNNVYADLLDHTTENPKLIGKATEDKIINVKNGLLDLKPFLDSKTEENPVLLPHTPYRFSVSQIPVNYDPEAHCPQILEFFDQVLLCKEDQEEMFKASGYSLIPSLEYHKVFLFYGSGGNGKGVMLGILKKFLGEDNCSNRSLAELSKDPFAKADLYGKLANVCGEVENNILPDTSIFKSLTGGDTITAQEKYKHSFTFQPYAKLFFSANELPRSRDKTRAMERRWHFFGFDVTFDSESEIKEDPKLLEKLTTDEELSGFLFYSIIGLQDLYENGFKTTSRNEELLSDWKEQDNPALLFIQDCLQKTDDPNHYISRSFIMKCYTEYHNKNASSRQQRLSAKDLNDLIRQEIDGIGEMKGSKCVITEKTVKCWSGLTYTDELQEIVDKVLDSDN